MTGVTYHSGKKKWEAVIRTAGNKIRLGTFLTEEEAIIAKMDYMNRVNAFESNYDLLAKDPAAWNDKSKEIIHQLSQRKDASKI